jgi:hypothetical protein
MSALLAASHSLKYKRHLLNDDSNEQMTAL